MNEEANGKGPDCLFNFLPCQSYFGPLNLSDTKSGAFCCTKCSKLITYEDLVP